MHISKLQHYSVIFCVVCRAALEKWQHFVSNDHNYSFVAATIL